MLIVKKDKIPDKWLKYFEIVHNEDCPCRLLDEQSGISNSSPRTVCNRRTNSTHEYGFKSDAYSPHNDSGGASRYFFQVRQDENDKVYKYGFSIIGICGNTLENQKADGILNGVIKEIEKYSQSVEQFISGKSIMENFQKDLKSIILNLTKLMTELKTCNLFQDMNIDYFMEEKEKTIRLLEELNIENAKDVKNINHLIIFKNELLELIKDIVKIAQEKNLKSGEKKIGNIGTHIIGNIEKNNSRFFYCAKANKSERNLGCGELESNYQYEQNKWTENDYRKGDGEKTVEPSKNNHPTVKPLKLMQYLVRLVTHKGGLVLDPFIGSGTTAIACLKEGFNFIGFEQSEDYCKIAEARIKPFLEKKEEEGDENSNSTGN